MAMMTTHHVEQGMCTVTGCRNPAQRYGKCERHFSPRGANMHVTKKKKHRDHLELIEALQHSPKKKNGVGSAVSATHQNGAAQPDLRRLALAAAIANRDAEKRELDATDKAIAECMRRINESKRAVDAAEQGIAAAKAQAAKNLIVKEMTGVEPSPLNPRIGAAREARQRAQDDLDAAMEAHATLTKGRGGKAASSSSDYAVEKAIGEIVLPAFVDLVEHYRSLQDQTARVKQHLSVLASATINVRGPEHRFWDCIRNDPKEDTSALRAAIARLGVDADANDISAVIEAVKEGREIPQVAPPPKPRDDKTPWRSPDGFYGVR